MGHEIAEAIIEDGQIKYVDRELPKGRIYVHLIYDLQEDEFDIEKSRQTIKDTAGLYKDIDIDLESRKLRDSWERNVRE